MYEYVRSTVSARLYIGTYTANTYLYKNKYASVYSDLADA